MANENEQDAQKQPEETTNAEQTGETGGAEQTGETPDDATDSEPDVTLPEPPAEPEEIEDEKDDALAALFRPFDMVLFVLAVLLAFFLASFAVGNVDFWLHLATGRYLAQNLFGLYSDPFTFSAANALWVNHNWLFDLVLYNLYVVAGGSGLVIAKAILIAALAFVLLITNDGKQSPWISIVCVVVALVAMGPRMLYQPILVSLLLLGITLFVLVRQPENRTAAKPFRYLWALVPLFILWVNLDGWFILGPLVVGLWLLAEGAEVLLSGAEGDERDIARGRLKTLATVFVVSLVACLVNPYFHNAFRLPVELSYLARDAEGVVPSSMIGHGIVLNDFEKYDPSYKQISGFEDVSAFTEVFAMSLFSDRYLGQMRNVYYPPYVCHFLLLIFGLLSFVGVLVAGSEEPGESSVWARFVVWLGFAVLSVLMIRLTPLFAVVAGPIMAMNWHSTVRGLADHVKPPPRLVVAWGIGGRLLTLALIGGLLFLVWPGWLRTRIGATNSGYRVDWALREDATLKETALWLAEWRKEGKVDQVYNMEPDIGCYLAWFAWPADAARPVLKYAFDYRYDLFRPRSESLAKTRMSLMPIPPKKNVKEKEKLRKLVDTRHELFRDNEVSHVVFSWKRMPRLAAPMLQSLWAKERWVMAGGNGPLAVFRWWPTPEVASQRAGKGVGVDYTALAFGKDPKQKERVASGFAFPERRDFWTNYLVSPGESAYTAKVPFYVDSHKMQIPRLLKNQRRRMSRDIYHRIVALQAGLLAAGPVTGTTAPPVVTSHLELWHRLPTPTDLDLTFPLLAVRAGRAAVREAAQDYDSYEKLGDALLNQWIIEQTLCDKNPQNRRLGEGYQVAPQIGAFEYWTQSLDQQEYSQRYELRRLATLAAYRNALVLQPNNARIHWHLAIQYSRRHFLAPQFGLPPNYYIDVALEHAQVAKALLDRGRGRQPETKKTQLEEEVDKIHAYLVKEVRARREKFLVQLSGLPMNKRFFGAMFAPHRLKAPNGKMIDVKLGLSGEALKILENTNLSQASQNDKIFVLTWRLRLLLGLGRVRDAYELLEQHKKDNLIPPEIREMTLLQITMAMGDYQNADNIISRFEAKTKEAADYLEPVHYVHTHIGPALSFHPATLTAFTCSNRFPNIWFELHLAKRQLADVRLIRGLAALEAGDVGKAETFFVNALEAGGRYLDSFDLDLAREYVRQIRAVNRRLTP